MVMVDIPSMAEIASGMSLVADGACDLASRAVQDFVSSPSLAQAGLHAVAAQIEALEQLIARLREVAAGIAEVQGKLASTVAMEWHSPAGEAFRTAVGDRKIQAEQLEQLTLDTARLATDGIDELRTMIAGLQTLLATARAALGDAASGVVKQVVCA
jgi:hypothetical protein